MSMKTFIGALLFDAVNLCFSSKLWYLTAFFFAFMVLGFLRGLFRVFK